MDADEMKVKIKELKEQSRRLHNEIEQLEKDYTEAACPWPKDTIVERTHTGKRYIVDESLYWIDDWAVRCTFIRKDNSFGSTTELIGGTEMRLYRVVKGYIVTQKGIVKDAKEQLAAWQDAAK